MNFEHVTEDILESGEKMIDKKVDILQYFGDTQKFRVIGSKENKREIYR